MGGVTVDSRVTVATGVKRTPGNSPLVGRLMSTRILKTTPFYLWERERKQNSATLTWTLNFSIRTLKLEFP
ncbi:hypothetical protein CEXT_39351 [Caerostris extrusa]|uniref:Uncharacterized protein n=1 Tax=Caerostris extrusa TaxID=172846 RepID=A0AAV4UVB2_CAEEX|nr:hypothetical protein CEXT_39351 [Caerostris extrusa]